MNQEPKNLFVMKVMLRQSIGSFRLVIALFTVTSAITKLLYDRFLPELDDYDIIRWSIISFGVVLFVCTFIKFKRRIIVPTFSLLLYLSTLLYVIAFVTINSFDSNAVIILILVYGASSMIINSMLYYGIQSVITILACVATLSANPESKNMIGLLNILTAIGVFGVVMTVRLKLITDIKNSFSNLEKLNVLSIVAKESGEIVFISPSVKAILGYSPEELSKDGWWTSKVREGWINRDYMSNYPNKIPKEIVSIERELLTKEGKTVWLSWENSILPNGNYMGVGLDITKYKK